MAANSDDDVLALTPEVSWPVQPQPPTQATPAVSAGPLFLGASQRDAVSDIRRTLAERHVFAAVTGAPGLGKTTVLSAAVAGVPPVIRVDHPDRVSVEHAEQLVAQASASPGARIVLVVDDADRASLSLLRALTRIADRRLPGAAQVVLAGRPELWDRLGADEFTPLRERIAIRPVLRPMTEEDARGLIRHLLNEPRKIFGQTLAVDAEREVLRLADGRPERIGALVRSTLMLSDLQIRPQLSVDMVHATADMLDGRQQPAGKRRVKLLRPVLAAGLAVAVTGGLAMAARDGRLERVLSAARDAAGPSAAGWLRQAPSAPAATVESALARQPEPALRQVEAAPPAAPVDAQEAERAPSAPPPAVPAPPAAQDGADHLAAENQPRPQMTPPAPALSVPATPEPVSPEAMPPEAVPPRADAPEPAPAIAAQPEAAQADAAPPEPPDALAGAASAFSASEDPSPAAETVPSQTASEPAPALEAAVPPEPAAAPQAVPPPPQAASTFEAATAPDVGAAAANVAANPDPAPDASAKTLAPGLVTALLRRGDEALARGDVSAARQFYERTVPSGSALGARGVARTYDPAVLGRGSPAADLKAAAVWYEKAARFDAHPEEQEPGARREASAQRLLKAGR